MTQDRHEQTESLFHEAMALDPSDRDAFLERACGDDPSLLEDVISLIAAHHKSSEFFERPAWSDLIEPERTTKPELDAIEPEGDLPFERLGQGEYRLIRRLGEGGMGVVYLAVQESLNRLVAIKAMRPERLSSPEALARFQREIDAISELRHPNIVTVFGSGEEQGLRFFIMEHVPGEGLDKVLARSRVENTKIPIPTILGWIHEIASALDSAHQARILHRDVKPSNIVIAPEGRAMLMDFGVARHMALSTLTLTGEFRGTPHYASPEQIRAKRGEIDGRTDIYSLGVTLYEAVTGRVPFEGETTEQVFKKILDDEPLPPRKLKPALSQDLETVILTAIEKEPAARYATMAEFAADLKRLVQGEMIHAKPAGMATRAWKRIRRNPVLSMSTAVAVVALLSLFLYVLWSYPQILRERDRAEAQREEAIKAKAVAETEAEKFQAINNFLETMLSSADPSVAGREVKVVSLLEGATEKIGTSFSAQPAVKAVLHETIGRTYAGLGLLEDSEQQLALAMEVNRRIHGEDHVATLSAMNNLATIYRKQARLDEAEALYEKILEKGTAQFGEEHSLTLAALQNLAIVYQDKGRLAESESLKRKVLEIRRRVQGEEDPETLKTMNNLASVCWQIGKLEEAEALSRELIEIKKRVFGEDHPSTLASLNNLGITLRSQGKLDDAEAVMRDVLDTVDRVLGPDHPDTLSAQYNLAIIFHKAGKLSESEELHRKTYEARQRILGDAHQATISSLHYLAIVCWERGKHSEAETLFKDVIARSEEVLGKAHPNTLMAIQNLIALYDDWNQPEKAAALRGLLPHEE